MKHSLLKSLFIPAIAVIVMLLSFTPDTVTAQAFVPCEGPDCNFCHFVTLANNVITWLIGVLAVVFGAMVFIAGIGLVTSGGNPSKLEEAKKSLTNALIGLIVVLASWLIVDTLLKAMLPNGTTAIGPWNTISCQGGQVVGGAVTPNSSAIRTQVCTTRQVAGIPSPTGCTCVLDQSTLTQRVQYANCQCRTTLAPGVQPASGCTLEVTQPPRTNSGAVRTAQCPPGNSACSVSSLVANGLTNTQANVMSCIAMTESGGNPSTPPYNQTHPDSNSSACGTFQIVKTTWDELVPRTPPAFRTGCADFLSSCRIAACNTAVVVALVKQRGFRPWICPSCNSHAQGCINHYGG